MVRDGSAIAALVLARCGRLWRALKTGIMVGGVAFLGEDYNSVLAKRQM